MFALTSLLPMNPAGTQKTWQGIRGAAAEADGLRILAWAAARAERCEARASGSTALLTRRASREERADAMDDLVRARLISLDMSPLSSAQHKAALLARISNCIWAFSNVEDRLALAAGSRGSNMTKALNAISDDVERLTDGPGTCQRH